MDQAQKNYSITDKELLAVVKSIEYFRHYMIGKPFILRTDHKAIEYLWSCKKEKSRIMRWALKLQDYSFKIQYIKGENNPADGLSRQINSLTIKKKSNTNKINLTNSSSKEKMKILHQYHELSGHASDKTMKFLIHQKYYWPQMNKDIEKFCSSCLNCKKCKGPMINSKI